MFDAQTLIQQAKDRLSKDVEQTMIFADEIADDLASIMPVLQHLKIDVLRASLHLYGVSDCYLSIHGSRPTCWDLDDVLNQLSTAGFNVNEPGDQQKITVFYPCKNQKLIFLFV